MARDFSFLPQQPVTSILSGRYASRLRGRGLNFEEIRRYLPRLAGGILLALGELLIFFTCGHALHNSGVLGNCVLGGLIFGFSLIGLAGLILVVVIINSFVCGEDEGTDQCQDGSPG